MPESVHKSGASSLPQSAALTVIMYKALYLAIVFTLPALLLLAPINAFQIFWIWIYIPFGFAFAIFIWLQPNEKMMKLVSITPLLFLILAFVMFSAWATVESGFYAALQIASLAAIVALSSFVIISVTFLLLAYGLYAIFKNYSFLPNDS